MGAQRSQHELVVSARYNRTANKIIIVKLHISHGLCQHKSPFWSPTSPPSARLLSSRRVKKPRAQAQAPSPATTNTRLCLAHARPPPGYPTQDPVPSYSLHSTSPCDTSLCYASTATTHDTRRHAHIPTVTRPALTPAFCEASPTCIENTTRHHHATWLRPRNHRGRAEALPVAPQGAVGGRM
jgi:hypothetical protein